MARAATTAIVLMAAMALAPAQAVAQADDGTGIGVADAVLNQLFPPPPPPETTIDSGPPASTTEQMATFGFSSDVPSATFECSLDGAEFESCTSPKTVGPLTVGTHNFQVRARADKRGVDPTPARRTVKVEAAQTPTPPPTGGGATSGGPTSAVPAAKPKRKPCTEVPRPLVRDSLVRKRPGMLLISFGLAARARVQAQAFHGAELVGRTKQKVLEEGSHELRLRYAGGKPTRLKMRAIPAVKNACR